MKDVQVNCIILKRVKYKETSLIISTLSPDWGRLDFLLKGGRSVSGKKYPVADLFREIKVSFKNKKEKLHTVYNVELVHAYDGIARYPKQFIAFSELSKFLIKNCHPEIPLPKLYFTLKVALDKLSSEKTEIPWCDIIKLEYLRENGLLPSLDDQTMDPQKQRAWDFVMEISDAIEHNGELPHPSDSYWIAFSSWINSLCHFHELV